MTTPAQSMGEDGFTLIETIIAFVVLALSLMVLSQSISQATTQIRTADISDSSRFVAERVLAAAQIEEKQTRGAGTDEASSLLWTWNNIFVGRSDPRSKLPTAILTVVEVRKSEEAAPLLVLKSIRYVAAAP